MYDVIYLYLHVIHVCIGSLYIHMYDDIDIEMH